MTKIDELIERLLKQQTIKLTDLIQVRAYLDADSALHHETVSTIEAQAAQIAALREALEFYADPNNHRGEFVPGGHTEHGTYVLEHHVNLVRRDAGERARAVLQSSEVK